MTHRIRRATSPSAASAPLRPVLLNQGQKLMYWRRQRSIGGGNHVEMPARSKTPYLDGHGVAHASIVLQCTGRKKRDTKPAFHGRSNRLVRVHFQRNGQFAWRDSLALQGTLQTVSGAGPGFADDQRLRCQIVQRRRPSAGEPVIGRNDQNKLVRGDNHCSLTIARTAASCCRILNGWSKTAETASSGSWASSSLPRYAMMTTSGGNREVRWSDCTAVPS